MISFSQNFEDVILARVFRHRTSGTYVDVGAHFPIIDSVTEHFYRNGWRGINVEPLPAAFAQLVAARPNDINLDCAVAAEDGSAMLFALDGFSTLNPAVAAAHDGLGRRSKPVAVRTQTLASLLDQSGIETIDFLKIDVEGAEGLVLRSNDWRRFRPAMVLAEAVHPVTQAAQHAGWEPILLDAGYEFVYFDGLNRFYWNRDLPAPEAACFLPPNVLDGFTPYAQIAVEARAAEQARLAQYERDHARQIAEDGASQLAAQTEGALRDLARIDGALLALAQGADGPPPHTALTAGWQALLQAVETIARPHKAALHAVETELTAALHAVETERAASHAALQEMQRLLKTSEDRRLALLESRGAAADSAPTPHISSIALSCRHIAPDARVYATREDLVRSAQIGTGGVIAEIGTATGDFSAFLIETLQPAQFIAFDTFDMHRYPSHWGTPSEVLFDGLTHEAFYRRRFAEHADCVDMVVGPSSETLVRYPDAHFDLLYVDACHNYDLVRIDALNAVRKLKPDGVLIFNDYTMYDPLLGAPYGVVQAVNEILVQQDLRVVGFALQENMFCDIALRRGKEGSRSFL